MPPRPELRVGAPFALRRREPRRQGLPDGPGRPELEVLGHVLSALVPGRVSGAFERPLAVAQPNASDSRSKTQTT